jgi:hypothetical protein
MIHTIVTSRHDVLMVPIHLLTASAVVSRYVMARTTGKVAITPSSNLEFDEQLYRKTTYMILLYGGPRGQWSASDAWYQMRCGALCIGLSAESFELVTLYR